MFVSDCHLVHWQIIRFEGDKWYGNYAEFSEARTTYKVYTCTTSDTLKFTVAKAYILCWKIDVICHLGGWGGGSIYIGSEKLRPRSWSPSSQVIAIRTDPRLVNNLFIFSYLTPSNHFYKCWPFPHTHTSRASLRVGRDWKILTALRTIQIRYRTLLEKKIKNFSWYVLLWEP